MKKSDLQEFIGKWHLNGILASADKSFFPIPVTVEDNKAKVIIRSADKSVLVDVDSNLEMQSGEFIIGDTKEFLTIISAFGDNIEITPKKMHQNYFNMLELSDNDIHAKFALADPLQIESRPQLNFVPEIDAEIPITKAFTDKFIKARKAIPSAAIFAVIPDTLTKKVDFVINFSENQNINSITVPVPNIEVSNEFEPLIFDCNYVAAILQENTEYRTATISVSSQQMMIIKFSGEDYDANYYLKALVYEGS